MHYLTTIGFVSKRFLEVPHDVTEVNVEHSAAALDHDVVVVAVPDPKHVHGHRVARAGVHEVGQGVTKLSLQENFMILQAYITVRGQKHKTMGNEA